MLAALLFGAMRTGAGVDADPGRRPGELVGVLQATILFFLVASPVIKRLFRLKGAETASRRPTTITSTYGGEATIP